ncbi:EamA family transporter [Sphingobacterium sp. SRCM116780]|uniref:EamA family transporter n=1 Tax=Sphingobacterium sp. SRCM116780 TaxID=2907623 RepID=UPI001F168121|nr:EamA family transporter [Sphingobacterium sp. SRCM116780]UIR56080.1 EamA family transporter [Sphingobacterium sp. SRCM116780]
MEKEKQDTESRGKYFLAAFLAPFIWGFMSISVRWIQNYPSEDILYFRILTALLVLWIYIFLFRRKVLHQDILHYKSSSKKEQSKQLTWILLASALIFVNWFTYIYAINHVSIQSAALAYLTCPLITAVAAFFLLHEKLNRTQIIALLMALVSVLILAKGSLNDVLWAIGIATSYAFYLIVQRVSTGFDKLNQLAIQLSICSVFVISKLIYNHHAIPTAPQFWYTILLIAVLFTIIPLFLSMYALTEISSTTAGVLLYTNPIIAFTLAVTYFGETVPTYKYMGYLLILVAIIIFNIHNVKIFSKNLKTL